MTTTLPSRDPKVCNRAASVPCCAPSLILLKLLFLLNGHISFFAS